MKEQNLEDRQDYSERHLCLHHGLPHSLSKCETFFHQLANPSSATNLVHPTTATPVKATPDTDTDLQKMLSSYAVLSKKVYST